MSIYIWKWTVLSEVVTTAIKTCALYIQIHMLGILFQSICHLHWQLDVAGNLENWNRHKIFCFFFKVHKLDVIHIAPHREIIQHPRICRSIVLIFVLENVQHAWHSITHSKVSKNIISEANPKNKIFVVLL